MQKKIIRNNIRQLRCSLPLKKRHLASKLMTQRVIDYIRVKNASNLALFLPFDGEINTYPLIDVLWKAGKNVFLPVLNPFVHGYLFFMQYTPNTSLVINKYKLYEPKLDINKLFPLEKIDIIFIPLVAFDKNGQRLGMGGGFYDRLLNNWSLKTNLYPIGLAYDCQKITNKLPIDEWDIPLPEIITPSRHWYWRS